jgi:glycosyltransferase involved in cell wall biosynthesis
MKKLLLINWRDIRNPETGGAETYYHEIFRRVAAGGEYDVTVLSHAFKGAPAREDIDGTHVIRMGSRSLFNLQIIPFVRAHQRDFDLIIEDLNKIPFFTRLYVHRPRLQLAMHFFGAAIFREVAFPFAAYVHAMESLIRLVYRGERFVAISGSTRADLLAMVGVRTRVDVVEPGVDTSFFRPTQPKSPTPTLVYVGRLKKYKNVQFVIRCLPAIRQQAPGVRLIIAGSGDYRGELECLVAGLHLGDAVSFAGFVSEEQKRDLLSSATLMPNPSVKEGWGITNIEANLCGTLSVSSNVHGLRDSVRDGETGVLYRPDDEADFAAKTVALLTDAARRAAMEAKAIEFGKTFAWDSMAAAMLTVLRSVA